MYLKRLLPSLFLLFAVLSADSAEVEMMNKPCFHGGDCDVSNNTCVCYGGYVGDLCERLMQDCSEGFLYSYYVNQHGNYLCQPNGAPKPIKVHCLMIYGGRALLMTQTSGEENFKRTWEEYKQGFGSLSGDHWLGNDNVHYITSGRTHNLLADLRTPGADQQTKLAQRFYADFLVRPEVDDYKMTFTSTFPNTELVQRPAECLVSDTPFSTPDVDHSSGAAGVTQSDFWFSKPPECNPTEQLKPRGTWGGDKTDVFWKDGFEVRQSTRSISLSSVVINLPKSYPVTCRSITCNDAFNSRSKSSHILLV